MRKIQSETETENKIQIQTENISNKIQIQIENVSDKNKIQNKTKNRLQQFVILLLTMILLLTGCGGSSSETLYGKDMLDEAKARDEQVIVDLVAEQKKKYERHYQNGLYFEDLSVYQKELNEKFMELWTKKVEAYILTKAPILKEMTWFFHGNVEYVNADVKEYAQGKKTAEEIITNPNSIMSMEVVFREVKEQGYTIIAYEGKNAEYGEEVVHLEDYLEKSFERNYKNKGVDFCNFHVVVLNQSILENHSIEELKQVKDIDLLAKQEGLEFKSSREVGLVLKQKYGIDFFFGYREVSPLNYPEVKFHSSYSYLRGEISESDGDHFLSSMYQYVANQYVRKIIDEAGLSERVVFLVSTEPYGGEYDLDNTNRQSYNFGKGYDERHFIKKGYTGSVDVTLIYLKTEGEEINYKALQDVIFKIDEQIGLGLYTDIAPEAKKDGSRKTVYVYSYDIDEYGRKVVVDLFKKHPLTEYDRNEDQEGFSDVFSLDQVTRAETPGFHYLNIFGKPVLETGSSLSSSDFYRFEENPKEYLNEESGLIFRLQE